MADIGEYAKKVIGTRIDVDGAYGPQCWDLAQHWVTANGGGNLSTQGGPHPGYAEGCWYAPQPGMTKISKDADPKPGDLVVWKFGLSAMPLSHIAIVLQKNAFGQVTTLSANSPQAEVKQQRFSTMGVLGYLRLSGVSGEAPDGDTPIDNAQEALDIGGIVDFFKMIRSPDFWKRAGFILAGAVLAIFVIVGILKESNVSTPQLPDIKGMVKS